MLYPASDNIWKYDSYLRVMLELVECCLLLQLPSQNVIRQILNVVRKYVITPTLQTHSQIPIQICEGVCLQLILFL